MTNAIYTKAKEKFLKGEISWQENNIKAVLVDTSLYTANLTTNEFLSDIPLNARVALSGNFTNKTSTEGVADADDITFPSVVGNSIEAVVIYKDTGVASTSPLIVYMDIASGLPITPTGDDITLVWSSGSNKIFRL